MDVSTRLRLRVSPGSGRAGVVGRHGEGWKVRVSAPPEAGQANEALLRLLAGVVGVPRSAVALVSGHGARDKTVRLDGVGHGQVERRLEAVSGGERGRRSGAR